MDFDTIDWTKVGAILKLLKFNLADAVENAIKQYTAENNQEMIQVGNNLLNRYQVWLVSNFESPEMDIALRMLFDEYLDENEEEHSFADNGKQFFSGKENELISKVMKTFSK